MAETSQSISSLFSDVINQLTHLFRTEFQLAKVELTEKLTQSTRALGFIVAGGVLATGALYLLLLWLIRLLVLLGIPEVWSTFIVAAATLVLAYALVRKGFSNLSASQLTPARTVDSVAKDVDLMKETVK